MRTWLPILVLAFTLYSFFDCARTDQDAIQRGPKWAWLLLIFFTELIGSIAWFAWGRPRKAGPRNKKGKIIPPDDDPDFLRKI